MNSTFPRLSALALLPLLLGCSSSDQNAAQSPTATRLQIEFAGLTPPRFVAILAFADNEIQTISCPASEPSVAECTPSGLILPTIPSTAFDLTVKAPGFQFSTQNIVPKSLLSANGNLISSVALSPVDTPKITEDYATGLYEEGGFAAFEKLAYRTDTELGPAQVVKFYIRNLSSKPELYLQNTIKHPLHYDFANQVLGQAQTQTEFEKETYHGEDRKALAGTLLYYPLVASSTQAALEAPITLTFFPSDDLTPSQAQLAYRLIEERLGFVSLAGGKQRLVYLPAGSLQEQQLSSSGKLFARHGDASTTMQDLYGSVSMQLLNPGIAYGTLRFMSPEDLTKAIVSYRDILLLSRLPNALPIVGGTITEELQTPLAHVNLAARSRGTPNIALLKASLDPKISSLFNKFIRFEVKNGSYDLREATLEEAQQYWDEHKKKPFSPTPDDSDGPLMKFDDVHFADAKRVGSKAANVAELFHILGTHAPYGFAVPFSYFNRYMTDAVVTPADCELAQTDCTDEGRAPALCIQVKTECIKADGHSYWQYFEQMMSSTQFQSDSATREASLNSLQYLVGHGKLQAGFGKQLDDLVQSIFADAKVRIRSSTNAEDLAEFNGAGLYDSVNAYAQGNKAASSQIRKVWASLFGWRAFEERSFWNLEHRSTRMGCAIEDSYPDEQANGVLITQNIANLTVAGLYVNVQKGEVSVTNPTDGSVPEVFSILPGPSGLQVLRQRYSSLSPSTALLSDSEVSDLYDASELAQSHFAKLYQKSPYSLILDLEFKFHGPERKLIIKQARPYTQAGFN